MQLATIADLTGDRVLYRDLEPSDRSLPGLTVLRERLGIAAGQTPRKRDAAYARIILELARAAQAARGGAPLTTVCVIGDTENDRLLAEHLQALGEVACYGFIAADRPVAPAELSWHGQVAESTRWALVGPWAAELRARGVDWSRTALLVDIDKTLLGPRGRCDGAIDEARAEAALLVAEQLLGADLDSSAFRRTYAQLCRREWHSLTLDNQDYTVAATLFAVAGALDLAQIEPQLGAAALPPLAAWLAGCAAAVPPALQALHGELLAAMAAGDPTPFKQFRRIELLTTAARMRDGRLTLCHDLFNLAAELSAAGALFLAASDKPAESALPDAAQLAAGLLPLHQTPAHLDSSPV
jgi:hypothetical protein